MSVHSTKESRCSFEPPISFGAAAAAMADSSSRPHAHTEVWREFVCGGIAAALGESLMHPVDTVKTRMQSGGSFLSTVQESTKFTEVLKVILKTDGIRGLYRGITPGMIGSFATGATYFGFIETTRSWLQERHPGLSGPLSHFFAGAIGDTVGSVVYVPCEVIKQRMQVQGSPDSWEAQMSKIRNSAASSETQYYRSFFHAALSIIRQEGFRGLYTGFGPTLARDVPFAGLMIVFYEGLAQCVRSGEQTTNAKEFTLTGFEDMVMGGVAGGISAFLTTPLDIIKTRLQVQGSTKQYNGWRDAVRSIWMYEGFFGFWKGSLPRVMWYVPASAVTFMAWQALRNTFIKPGIEQTASVSMESGSIDAMTAVVPHSSQAR